MNAHLGTYYGGAAWAIRDGLLQTRAFLRPDTSVEDARAAELDLARDLWPEADGWAAHGVAAVGVDLTADIIAARSER